MTAKAKKLRPLNAQTEALGAKYRSVRKGRKMTLRSMAGNLSRSINTIRWHEAGARMMRADDIVKSADELGVEPGELLNVPGESNANTDPAASTAA
jgi:transcriptional regulator with XRE-family HTH domain